MIKYPPLGHRPDGCVYNALDCPQAASGQYCRYCDILRGHRMGYSLATASTCQPPRLQIFDDFLTSSWDPHFIDFRANLASKNRPKIDQKSIQNVLFFLIGCWIDFLLILGAKVGQKSFQKSIRKSIAKKSEKKRGQEGHNTF